MVTMCPKCGSEHVSERNIGRKAGGIAGGVAGALWICPYISRHLLSLNPLLARCRRYSRGER